MAVNVLTPIETRYKGILFRSRIEARWALFYDKIRVPYEYEKEGYVVGKTPYLPDFWMPQQDCFIEIKGAPPSLEEEAKASLLAQESGKRVFIFYSSIPTIVEYGLMNVYANPADTAIETSDSAYLYTLERSFDNQHFWCECRFCGAFDIQYNGRSGRMKCCEKNIAADDDKAYNSASDRLVYAYNAARSARFGT